MCFLQVLTSTTFVPSLKTIDMERMYKFSLALLAIGMITISSCTKDDNDDDGGNLAPIMLDCDFFETDQVLTDDPDRPVDYVVPCYANVRGEIIVQPGVVIEFEDEAGLGIVGSGYLKVEGTASKKVIFTAVNKVKGAWLGIAFFNQSVNNSLDHAAVRYAGGGQFNSNGDIAGVLCYTCKVSVTNTEISNSAGTGFASTYTSSEVREFSNNVLTDNDNYPVETYLMYAHAYESNNDFTGNAKDYLFVFGDRALDGERTWKALNVPYRIDGEINVTSDDGLTIEAGAELRFNASSGIKNFGFLVIQGTATEPVLLTGYTEASGAWLGLFNDSDDVRNLIDHAEVAYAGGGSFNSNGDLGAIIVWADSYTTISNTTIRDSGSDCGINAEYNDETLNTSNLTFTNITTDICQ